MNRLLIAIVIAIGLAFGSVVVFEGDMAQVAFVGTFFLKALKMIIVPLIFFSMVSGITSLGDVRKLGRLGGRTVLYYACTTLIAVVLGTIMVNLFQPGVGLDQSSLPQGEMPAKAVGASDILLSFVHDNIIQAAADLKMLPIIVFSMLFGAVLTTIGDKGRPVIAFCEGGNEAMMKIVHIIMYLAPIGIFGLVAGTFGKHIVEAGGLEGFYELLDKLASYMVTVIVGLSVHAFIILPLILWVTTKRSPLRYAQGMASALVTAFSTASSAATMPMTLTSIEQNNKVNSKASRFVIPLGATINMDGTALYEAVAVIFIAQVYGVDLSLGQQIVVVFTATLAAIGAAGIPHAGMVTMLMVLAAVDLPAEGITLIVAVDWLLDRFRTTVNVWGDAVGAGVVERYAEPAAAPAEDSVSATP